MTNLFRGRAAKASSGLERLRSLGERPLHSHRTRGMIFGKMGTSSACQVQPGKQVSLWQTAGKRSENNGNSAVLGYSPSAHALHSSMVRTS